MPSRVVVTGRGVISALGHNCSDFWKALVEGRPGIGALESVDRSLLRFQNGAEVRGYDPARVFRRERNRAAGPVRAIWRHCRARSHRGVPGFNGRISCASGRPS